MWSCGTAAAVRSEKLVTRRMLVELPGPAIYFDCVELCICRELADAKSHAGSVSVFGCIASLHLSSACPSAHSSADSSSIRSAATALYHHGCARLLQGVCVSVCGCDLCAALTRLQGLEMWLRHGQALITVITYCWILYILYCVLDSTIGCLWTTHSHTDTHRIKLFSFYYSGQFLLWLNS